MVRKPVAAATATSSGGVVSSTVRWAREICRPVILRLDYALDRAKGGRAMRMKNVLYLGVAVIAIAAVWAGSAVTLSAQQATSGAVPIDADDIGGVVTGPNGPEAGVWVIAETTDLPTKFAKMVVTDDQGRYVIPDLPKAKYRVWVRGYGLVDSPKIDSQPGKQLNLTAVKAPDEKSAAQYYPAIYWYSMIKTPDASQFP